MDAKDPNHTNDNEFSSSAAAAEPVVPIVPPRPAESPSKRSRRISFATEVQCAETFHPEDYDRTNDAYDIEKNVVEMEMEVCRRRA